MLQEPKLMMNEDLKSAYQAFKSNPTSRSQFNSLAKALVEKGVHGDLLRASRLFEPSGKDPRLVLYYQRYALFGLRRYEPALEAARSLAASEDAHPNDFVWIAKILMRLHRNDEAAQIARDGLVKWPNHESLTKNLQTAVAAASRSAPQPSVAIAAPVIGVRPPKVETGKRKKGRR